MQSSILYQQFAKQITPLIEQGHTRFSVALSGGVDSVVLLHLLKTMQAFELQPELQIEAVYVNHGLSNYADDWQGFCEDLCQQLAVPFKAIKVAIEPQSRTSLEAQARDARYQALDATCMQSSVILLGQHLNDQLETFFLRLKRGSGLQGLGAMKPLRQLSTGRVCFRPLLYVTRAEVEQFAQQHLIDHITDDSNTDERFDRNYIRSQVMPVLTERFKGFEKSVARSIELLQQQQTLLDEYTSADLQLVQNPEQGISCSQLAGFSEARQANLVRFWLLQFTPQLPSQKQLQQILSQGLTAKADAQIKIRLIDGDIRRHQGFLYFVKPQVDASVIELSADNCLLCDGRRLTCMQGRGIRVPLATERVSIRFNESKARFKPLHKPGSNTLKHWFKDAKLAPWLRAHVPLVFYNEQLVQVVGYFINADYAVEHGVFWSIENE